MPRSGGWCTVTTAQVSTRSAQITPARSGSSEKECLDLVTSGGDAILGVDLGAELAGTFAQTVVREQFTERRRQVAAAADPDPGAEALLVLRMPTLVEHARNDRRGQVRFERQRVRAVGTGLHDRPSMMQQVGRGERTATPRADR